MTDALLRVQNLQVHFPTQVGHWPRRQNVALRAVEDVSFELKRGETLGLVGESGCGKSTAGRALLQLMRPTAGQVWFDGQELTQLWQHRLGRWAWDATLRNLRRRMQLIFQDPYGSLNPRMTVEEIVGEPLRIFKLAHGAGLRQRVQELLQQVGMDPRYVRRYPHEFSGGQRQRLGIARALALSPDLIVADEPISALDVSIQAQILNLLQELRSRFNLTYIFIAHDLAAVRHISQRVAVMYLGRIVEIGPADTLYLAPQHPYTKALLAAVPHPDPRTERARRRVPLVGDVPSPINPPRGCPFHPRCPERIARCMTDLPVLRQVQPGVQAACHVAGTAPPAPA